MESVEKSLEEIVKALHKQNEILDQMIAQQDELVEIERQKLAIELTALN